MIRIFLESAPSNKRLPLNGYLIGSLCPYTEESVIYINALLHAVVFPATCNATDDERQVAEYMLRHRVQAATYLAMFLKVEV